jgi:hypothetical protein
MKTNQNDFLKCDNPNTDKIRQHGYHRFYGLFLNELRGKHVELLEIGLNHMGSVSLWKDYFNNGVSINGIDIDDKTSDLPDVFCHKVDQSNESDLSAFSQRMNDRFDVIIDDGSHVPLHQMLTLRILWPTLRAGGVYILEDIETSYWGKSTVYGYPFDATTEESNTVETLRHSIDAVNSEFLGSPAREALKAHPLGAVLAGLEMVTFAQNCIVLVKKNPADFSEYYDREYRFLSRINETR